MRQLTEGEMKLLGDFVLALAEALNSATLMVNQADQMPPCDSPHYKKITNLTSITRLYISNLQKQSLAPDSQQELLRLLEELSQIEKDVEEAKSYWQ